jgi:hypothetical protein
MRNLEFRSAGGWRGFDGGGCGVAGAAMCNGVLPARGRNHLPPDHAVLIRENRISFHSYSQFLVTPPPSFSILLQSIFGMR